MACEKSAPIHLQTDKILPPQGQQQAETKQHRTTTTQHQTAKNQSREWTLVTRKKGRLDPVRTLLDGPKVLTKAPAMPLENPRNNWDGTPKGPETGPGNALATVGSKVTHSDLLWPTTFLDKSGSCTRVEMAKEWDDITNLGERPEELAGTDQSASTRLEGRGWPEDAAGNTLGTRLGTRLGIYEPALGQIHPPSPQLLGHDPNVQNIGQSSHTTQPATHSNLDAQAGSPSEDQISDNVVQKENIIDLASELSNLVESCAALTQAHKELSTVAQSKHPLEVIAKFTNMDSQQEPTRTKEQNEVFVVINSGSDAEYEDHVLPITSVGGRIYCEEFGGKSFQDLEELVNYCKENGYVLQVESSMPIEDFEKGHEVHEVTQNANESSDQVDYVDPPPMPTINRHRN
ncbi:hypothetical protein QQ045_001745 [Rhodiola kirilowii]